jgi:hypothetical protein
MLSLLVFVVSVAAQSCAFVGSKGLCSETCNAGVFVLTSDGAAGCESAELAQPARVCCVEAKCTAMQKEGFCGTSSLCKLTSVERGAVDGLLCNVAAGHRLLCRGAGDGRRSDARADRV